MAPGPIHLPSTANRSHAPKTRLLNGSAVLIVFVILLCLVVRFPAPPLFHNTFRTQKTDQLPLLHLDYATYKASLYDIDYDFYTFRNIRFAAPPLGELRWRKPAPPPQLSDIQDGSEGFDCHQGWRNFTEYAESEDCLFLDVYVPGAAIRNPEKSALPSVVWLHGGTNRVGAKDRLPTLFYNATGILETAHKDIIFVSVNYRLGAFGWLAGDTSEKYGLPNAGLHDQRAAFEWVQKYIHLLGGDPKQTSAWGESAGASNIFHLLVAQGGTLDPLFSRALLQSPSTLSNVDRLGDSEDCFELYSQLAGCETDGYKCLRNATSEVLATANMAWLSLKTNCGNLASDGTFIRQAATLEFASGNYWKGLDSLIVTHASNEPDLFLPEEPLNSDSDFEDYLTQYFPDYAKTCGVFDAMIKFFPSPSAPSSPYKNQEERLAAWILNTFTATRLYSLIQSYLKIIYVGQYSVPSSDNGRSLHSADLIPLFWNRYWTTMNPDRAPPFNFLVPRNIVSLSKAFQSVMYSFAKTGDPNKIAIMNEPLYPLIPWPHVGPFTENGLISNVVNFGKNGSTVITDPNIMQDGAEFVQDIVVALTNVGGYAVPGTIMENPIADCESNTSNFSRRTSSHCASRNYVDQCDECRYQNKGGPAFVASLFHSGLR